MTGAIVEYASIASSEENAWREALGAEITVKPLPDYLTKDVGRRLSELGFQLLVYIPDLRLHEPTLRRVGPEAYMAELARRYPRWHPFEDLSFAEKTDYRLFRNLIKWFWSEIKNRRIEFPQLPGRWMAVENVENRQPA